MKRKQKGWHARLCLGEKTSPTQKQLKMVLAECIEQIK
jgi:hypothetical protein